jgi:hypothetical protein
MNESLRFCAPLRPVIVAMTISLLARQSGLGRADDIAVEQTSTRSILAGQADIRIVGAHYSTDSAAPSADVRLAQPDAPRPLPLPADSNSQHSEDNGGNSPPNFVPLNPGQQDAGAQNAAPQPGARQPQTLPPAPAAPAQRPLPQHPGEANEIDGGWKPIGAITFASQLPPGDVPQNLAEPRFARAGEIVAEPTEHCDDLAYTYDWQASAFCCGPLYFEEPNLERYGYTHGILQPIISGAHFFTTIPALPYKMVVHPPHECVYTLGYYRPGDPAPRQRVRDPFRLDAAAIEAALVVGIFLAAP